MINIMYASLIFAIWSVTLFLEKEKGLSVFLFVMPFILYINYLMNKKNKIVNKKSKILIIPITILSFTYCLYNNSFFNFLNMFIIPILIVYMILEMFNERIDLKFDLLGKIIGVLFIPISFIGETVEKLRTTYEEKYKVNTNSKNNKMTSKIARALVITLPLILFIILLLSSADQIFGNIFINFFDEIFKLFVELKFINLIIRFLLIIICFIYFISFFDYIISRYEVDENIVKENKLVDNFTIKMLLSILNIIYLVFCIIQIKSLFLKNVSINYADYARKGFFQLMIVSVINLITILIAKKYNKNDNRFFINLMSIIMIIFTFIILISSAYRMHLYESAYGYTMLRLLVYCSLFTESVMLIPTVLYIIDKPINLARTYIAIVLSVYVCMNLAGFENIIARKNVDRYIETGKIDMYYLDYIVHTDAIKQMIRLYNLSEDNELNNYIKEALNQKKIIINNEKLDYRSFNFSKYNAQKELEKIDIIDN